MKYWCMWQQLQTASALIGISHNVRGGGEDGDCEGKDRCQMGTAGKGASNEGFDEMKMRTESRGKSMRERTIRKPGGEKKGKENWCK